MSYTIEQNGYRYKLFNCGCSSTKNGPCEVCGKFVSDMYHQTESRQYLNKLTGKLSWTTLNCHDLFGHKECLEAQQR